MGFSSIDDMLSEMTAGKNNRCDFNKVTGAGAFTTGRWYDFSGASGYPVANAFAGTSLAWTSCNESAGNGTQIFGLPHGGNVSTDTKHVINVMAVSGVSTAVPSVMMLVDMQGYWPGISVNTTSSQTLTGTPSPRYTNGAGCRLFGVMTTGSGGTAHNLSISYTNQAGTSGKAMPVTVAMTTSAIVSHIPHSGTAANNYGPFLPLANGDTGVQNVASVQFSAASGAAGVMALCLVKPLLYLPLTTQSVAAERDLVNQLPSLPRVYDGACLTWLFFAGAATGTNSSFVGSVDFAWG